MAIPLFVAVAGTAISAWSKYQAGQAEASAYGKAADAKRRQANSIMDRFDLNSEFTRMEGKLFKGKQVATLAQSNVDIGSGFGLSALEHTAQQIERRVDIAEMEAEASRDALLMAADLDEDRAQASRDSGTLGAAGSVASGFMSYYGSK